MQLFKNKFFIFGNLLLLLITIPLILFFLRQQTEVRTKAAATTQLFFSPASATSNVNNTVKVDIMVNPGQNIVSIVNMFINYDPTILQLASKDDIQINTSAFPVTLRGPILGSGTINISVNIGSDISRAVQTTTKVATITFRATSKTSSGPTIISFDESPDSSGSKKTQVFSLAASDQPGENVLQNTQPASVTVNEPGSNPQQPASPTPTIPSPSPSPTGSLPPPSRNTPTGAQVSNQPPICTSLVADRAANGTAPFSLSFIGSATDSDGQLTKAEFTFGDKSAQTATTGGGLGTGKADVQIAHTYNNPGIYNAVVNFTDNAGAASVPSQACSVTVSVSAPVPTSPPLGGSDGGSGGNNGLYNTPPPSRPTLPPTGNSATSIGIIGGILFTILGGAALLFL